MSNGSLRFQLHDHCHSLGQSSHSYIWSAPNFFSSKSDTKSVKKYVRLDDTTCSAEVSDAWLKVKVTTGNQRLYTNKSCPHIF